LKPKLRIVVDNVDFAVTRQVIKAGSELAENCGPEDIAGRNSKDNLPSLDPN
jgi:hypothetical protein